MNETNTTTSFQGTEVPPRETPPNVSYVPTGRVLQRKNRMIAGVAGGLADCYHLDVTIVRLVLVTLALLTLPAMPIAYLIAWIIIPDEDKTVQAPAAQSHYAPAPAPVPSDETPVV